MVRPDLRRLVMFPVATMGVVAAVIVWEAEHVGSLVLAISIGAGATIVAGTVVWQVRQRIQELTRFYESLLNAADESSRRADSANRAKDEFLATLSHELRTPLNSVLGWSRLLATGKLDDAQARRAVQAIERAGWTQSRLVDDLLDVSRIVSGKLHISLRPVLVCRVVEAAVQSLRPAADAKQIALEVDCDQAEGIEADPDRLQQMIWNLLSNAIKFTPAGGRAAVNVRWTDGELVVTVADTGIGFTPDVAERLFERFQQGDSSVTRAYGGLGLGLGIVRHLVELHGGTVTAHSAGVGQGSTFIIRLPAKRAAVPLADRHTVDPPVSLDHVRVLVVDDDATTLQMARTTLERCGASVMTASSAREAHEQLMREPPDVLVSDVVMPGEDGLELIQRIRALDAEHGGSIPAAALTAFARSDDRRLLLNAGYQMHLTKPIDPSELVAAVDRLAHRERSNP